MRARFECSYCHARNTHEYLGFSAGLDFETKITFKENAPDLLRREFSSPKWKPQTPAMSGVTDCYQPIERQLQLTRRCLAVLAEFRNPVSIIIKNYLATRDINLLGELAAHHAVKVHFSINSLESGLARLILNKEVASFSIPTNLDKDEDMSRVVPDALAGCCPCGHRPA
jgi:DNA repair photolyase